MKIMHIVGNRPQFIKLAPISREIKKRYWDEVIIHTGQHYDENMSDIFFEELGIPTPKINLGVGSGSHAQVTAKVIERLEDIVIEEKPDGVVIYGDTNSTLAAAIVVAKLNIPVFHVESGPRTYDRKNPEEKNRIVVDHLSDYLFAPDEICVKNLTNEGIVPERIILTGDVMYDQFCHCAFQNRGLFFKEYKDDFILMTWHREENTCSKARMKKMLRFISNINYKIVLPLHPRTKKMLIQYGLWQEIYQNKKVFIIEPVGYKEMTILLTRCKLVVSDSGGVSKEAFFAGKVCFFPLNLVVWPELVKAGYINIVDIEDETSIQKNIEKIIEIWNKGKKVEKRDFFGNGSAAATIANVIEKTLCN